VWPVGLYSLSSLVLEGSALDGTGLGPPIALSVSILLLSWEFSSLGASNTSAFLFLYSANSSCILAWAFRMHDMLDEGPASPISSVVRLVGTSAPLPLVDTIVSG